MAKRYAVIRATNDKFDCRLEEEAFTNLKKAKRAARDIADEGILTLVVRTIGTYIPLPFKGATLWKPAEKMVKRGQGS